MIAAALGALAPAAGAAGGGPSSADARNSIGGPSNISFNRGADAGGYSATYVALIVVAAVSVALLASR